MRKALVISLASGTLLLAGCQKEEPAAVEDAAGVEAAAEDEATADSADEADEPAEAAD